MRNIIVPVDFSEDSLKGIEIGLLFSRHCPVNIQMVYVQKKSKDFQYRYANEEYNFAECSFERLIEKYSSELDNDSKLHYIIKQGKIYEEVVNQAHAFKESIIAASTHGASGFEEVFIGSNALKIITATSRPVIAMRKGKVPKKIDRIVFPVTAVNEARQKAPYTLEMAKLFNAEVHVIAVTTNDDWKTRWKLKIYLKQISRYFKDYGVNCITNDFQSEDVAELTTNYANDVKANLISVVSPKGSGLFMSSFSSQIINGAEIPVLNLQRKYTSRVGSFRAFGG